MSKLTHNKYYNVIHYFTLQAYVATMQPATVQRKTPLTFAIVSSPAPEPPPALAHFPVI